MFDNVDVKLSEASTWAEEKISPKVLVKFNFPRKLIHRWKFGLRTSAPSLSSSKALHWQIHDDQQARKDFYGIKSSFKAVITKAILQLVSWAKPLQEMWFPSERQSTHKAHPKNYWVDFPLYPPGPNTLAICTGIRNDDDEGLRHFQQVEMIIKGLETDNQKMNVDMYPRLMMKIKCYGETNLWV